MFAVIVVSSHLHALISTCWNSIVIKNFTQQSSLNCTYQTCQGGIHNSYQFWNTQIFDLNGSALQKNYFHQSWELMFLSDFTCETNTDVVNFVFSNVYPKSSLDLYIKLQNHRATWVKMFQVLILYLDSV